MSTEKKPKVIHVDKLIVKANEVIIIDERRRHHHRDPWRWGFGARPEGEIEGGNVEVENDHNDIENVEQEVEELRRQRRPRPW